MDLILLLRAGYLVAAASVLLVSFVPALSSRFLAYGARASASSTPSAQREKAAEEQPDKAPFSILLNRLADLTVPHGWFTSFYVVSTACLLFWASQILTRGPAFRVVAGLTTERSASMTFHQVLVAWAMMLVQSSRRLYECLEFSSPANSKSQMWFGHWVLGLGFYIATSMAVWIEGIQAKKVDKRVAAIATHTFTLNDLALAGPSLRAFTSILLFILASGLQHDCHAYLASLKSKAAPSKSQNGKKQDDNDGYTLPTHPAFTALIAPHYTAECAIYASLAIVAAPQGAWVNWTLFCALVFVAVNLGVTAEGTKRWYEARFGRDAVRGRWRMVPGVY